MNVARHRLIVFTVAGALAGLVGVMHALSVQTVTPSDTNVPITVQALLITVIGGSGSFWGPVLGAVFVRMTPHCSTSWRRTRRSRSSRTGSSAP